MEKQDFSWRDDSMEALHSCFKDDSHALNRGFSKLFDGQNFFLRRKTLDLSDFYFKSTEINR